MEQFSTYFAPTDYYLSLTFQRQTDSVAGTVKIEGSLSKNDDIVRLHAVDMKITQVTFQNLPCEYKYDEKVIEIPVTDKIRSETKDDPATFEIQFETALNHNMQGCYVSTYQHDGAEQKLIATQFESHYAREAFPCIDEPGAKAVFHLTLTVPDQTKNDVVIANTPVAQQDGSRFEFEPTPRMSTYLLAWVVGPLKSVSTINQNGIKVTSYAALNQPVESLKFANETAARTLEYFDERFGQPYPLPKLDQVALPDFEAGAMENWGLVTYRESCLLADETAALDTKQSVAVTVTHELSHQWFGDLVTMAWWDDLWLNESFATIMEYYATDALYPDFQIWQDFFTGDCVAALRRDALPGVQAVKQAVHHPSEIATLFDSAIVYAKGARLILMLIRLLGEDKFNQGIKDYFAKFKYQNTVGDDLWAALQPYADFDVREFMHEWISQPGYPMLDGENQKRFLLDGSTDSTTWPLPRTFDDMSGHYLIQLSDQEFTERLAEFDQLSLEQRLRLLIDRLLLAKTPAVASDSLLDLLPKFTSETSAAVWSTVTSLIGDLKFFCPTDSEAEHNYQSYLRQLFQPAFDDLNYGRISNDTNATQLRAALINVAIYAHAPQVIERLVNLYRDDLTEIDSELRASVMTAKLWQDESTIFPELLTAYSKTSDPELRADLLFTIGSFATQPQHLDQLFALLENPKIVRPQDHIFLYIYLLRNSHTRQRVVEWLTTHWSYVERLTGEKSIEDYPRYAAALIRTPAEAKIFYDFFDSKSDDPILKRTLKIARFEIDARLNLIASDAPAVQEKLQEFVGTHE